jgi:hypothetical protein
MAPAGPAKACAAEVREYKACLKASACAKAGGKLSECSNVATECDTYRAAYSLCKRNQLNMRTRFRGPKGQRNSG